MRGRGLAVAAAVLIVAAACSGDEEEPVGRVDASYVFDGALSCDGEVNEAPTLPLSDVPTELLVCADPESSSPWTAPADLIKGDLGELTRTLAGLERAPEEDYECTFQGGPGYDLLLRLPADLAVRVHGDTGGCGVVSTSGREWFGAQEVLDVVLAAVGEQRSRTRPPARVPPVDLDCNAGQASAMGPALSLTGETVDLTRLISCWQSADERPPFAPGTVVAPRDVRALAADMAAHAFEGRRGPALRCPGGLNNHYAQHLFGQTRWGDVMAVYGSCRQFNIVGDPVRWWAPSPASQRILDDLRG